MPFWDWKTLEPQPSSSESPNDLAIVVSQRGQMIQENQIKSRTFANRKENVSFCWDSKHLKRSKERSL